MPLAIPCTKLQPSTFYTHPLKAVFSISRAFHSGIVVVVAIFPEIDAALWLLSPELILGRKQKLICQEL